MMPIVQRIAIFATKPIMSKISPRMITGVSYSAGGSRCS
jgi:hypothetical protein